MAVKITPAQREELIKTVEALHERGYNCAQSVFLTFAPLMGLDELSARKLMQGFGGGMGGLGEACGALSGAVAALGMLSEAVTPGNQEEKERFYTRVKVLGEAFAAKAGGTRCPELKLEDPGERKKACGSFMTLAVELVMEAIGA